VHNSRQSLVGLDATARPGRLHARLCHAFLVVMLVCRGLCGWSLPSTIVWCCLVDVVEWNESELDTAQFTYLLCWSAVGLRSVCRVALSWCQQFSVKLDSSTAISHSLLVCLADLPVYQLHTRYTHRLQYQPAYSARSNSYYRLWTIRISCFSIFRSESLEFITC